MDAEKKWVDTLYCKYIVAVISATNSEVVTFPLDLLKTRLQVQGETAAAREGVSTVRRPRELVTFTEWEGVVPHAPYKGMFRTGKEIVQSQGVLKLWEGLTPAIWRHVIYSGVRVVVYQQLRTHVLKTEANGHYPLWKSCTNGIVSGVTAQFLANPADLVKVQLQMEDQSSSPTLKAQLVGGKIIKLPIEAIRLVTSASKSLKAIFAAGGLRGLWAGAVPNMQRAAMVNLGDLTGYDMSKRFFLQFPAFSDNIVTHMLSSLVAGIVAAILTTPFDTLKTRLMNQPTDDQGRGLLYKNTTDCLLQSVRNEGPFSLYKGFLPLYLRLGPWAFVFWISYENIEKLLALKTIEDRRRMVPSPVPATLKTNYADSFWCTYCVSVIAAITYPLDLTKTRLQIQGEKAAQSSSNAAPYRGMLQTALGISREEGLLKLWQGVTPAIYRHVIYSGIRIVSYETLRDKIWKKEPDGSFPVWKSAMSGVTSGALAQFFASPTDLVKVQIQMEGRRRLLGKPPRVHSPWDAFTKILQSGGVRGLWKGSIPNVQRAALVNLGDLTTYDSAKRFILTHTSLTDNHLTHMLSSICAGLVAATMGTPADVVKTRIMNQPTDSKGNGLIYKSSVDCLVKTVENEGLFALYKGFIPVWIRMAPWSLTFWLSFEQIRFMLGATGF
ncbi:hypothetical protein C0J52_03190 [Blattella germanica]|nr:hypothetical protein C0J52_03190 [Blattella germanica]